jgi:DNA-binding GntR family transcriptional regulator
MSSNVTKLNRPSLDHLRVTPKTLVEEVRKQLKEAIFTGLLKPGDRLIEAELCASLGVSRPALREAIRGLHAERLCEITPHKGAQIPILSWDDAQQIYHARALLEGEAAALCAINISNEGIKELGAALQKFGEAVHVHDPYQQVEATALFYSTILKHSGNTVIEEMLQGLLARVSFLRARSMSIDGRSQQSYIEMETMLSAITQRDPDLARAAAKDHVLKAKEAARSSYFADEAQSSS